MRTILYLTTFLCVFSLYSFEPISNQEAMERLRMFDISDDFVTNTFTQIKDKKKYSIHEGNISTINPGNNSPIQIKFQYYRSKQKGKLPLVIISPTIGGQTVLERIYAKYFAKKGFHAVIANMESSMTDIDRPLANLDLFSIEGIVSIKTLLNFFSDKNEIDTNNFFAIGSSLGGIRTSLALGVEPRIKAGVTFVAGGDVPEILTTSEQKIVVKYREARMQAEKINTDSNFQEKLEDVIQIDPLHFSRFRKKEDLIMIIGDKDKSVPTKNQYDLLFHFDTPIYRHVPAGHVPTILLFPFYLRNITSFFKSKIENQKFEFKKSWFDKMYSNTSDID